jgi:RimJ/RimL family protein N-acetyltransferase
MNQFYIEEAQLVKSASSSEYSIDPSARNECEHIMSRIYDEDKSYWPYGLSIAGHNGGMYMIRKASTNEAVGFTGWQERWEDGEKVGYYSIGVLPEYRGHGFAKKAVSQIIAKKASSVDKVKAFILPHNKRSISMATSLGVPITHVG